MSNELKTITIGDVDIILYLNGGLAVSTYDGQHDFEFVSIPSEDVPAFVEAVTQFKSVAAVLATLVCPDCKGEGDCKLCGK